MEILIIHSGINNYNGIPFCIANTTLTTKTSASVINLTGYISMIRFPYWSYCPKLSVIFILTRTYYRIEYERSGKSTIYHATFYLMPSCHTRCYLMLTQASSDEMAKESCLRLMVNIESLILNPHLTRLYKAIPDSEASKSFKIIKVQ